MEAGVIYRTGLNVEDYTEAIEALMAARRQVEAVARGEAQGGCDCCGDSGHLANECHHNPLVMARRGAKARGEYRCFHCGKVFTDHANAEAHFGKAQHELARCLSNGFCPKRQDGTHCEHWWDGDAPCCGCGYNDKRPLAADDDHHEGPTPEPCLEKRRNPMPQYVYLCLRQELTRGTAVSQALHAGRDSVKKAAQSMRSALEHVLDSSRDKLDPDVLKTIHKALANGAWIPTDDERGVVLAVSRAQLDETVAKLTAAGMPHETSTETDGPLAQSLSFAVFAVGDKAESLPFTGDLKPYRGQ